VVVVVRGRRCPWSSLSVAVVVRGRRHPLSCPHPTRRGGARWRGAPPFASMGWGLVRVRFPFGVQLGGLVYGRAGDVAAGSGMGTHLGVGPSLRSSSSVTVTWPVSCYLSWVVSEEVGRRRRGAYLGESSAMASSRGVGSGGDAARAVVVVVVGRKKRRGNGCTLFPHLGGVGPLGPKGGIYLLKSLL